MNNDKPLKLGEILLQAKIIDPLQLNTALKYQREWDRKLGEALVELGFISEPILVKILSKCLNVPAVDLTQVKINPAALQKIPRRLAEKNGVMPIDLRGKERNKELYVAMIDPTNLAAIDEIAFVAGCKIKPLVATHSEIEATIRRQYGEERVVDVFFSKHAEIPQFSTEAIEIDEAPLRNVPANSPQNHEAKPSEEMVILQGGEEKSIGLKNVEEPAPEQRKPILAKSVNEQAFQSENIAVPMPTPETHSPSLSQEPRLSFPLSGDLLSRALVRLLIRQGVIQSEEIEEEINKLRPKES